MFKEEREEDDEGWIDQFDKSNICNEGREEKIGFKLEDEWEGVDIEKVLQEGPSPQGDSLCAIESYTVANQDMEALKDEEKSESTMSDLDDMWYTGDKEK
jgi:hypothetical protein